ncbi:hypothetical protein ES695_20285 [Candidatus Atribacteria bacterium 1244-E10-H5-B2]|nr:MAG: hypothetical protein ES695_20285 [Candidatus Atribacteria bacterium 1244-E10-H5-B2]
MNSTAEDIVKKVWRKVEDLAERRGMTRDEFVEWSNAEQYKSNISENEILLIKAYYINEVIERLETAGKDNLARKTEADYYWIKRFKKDFDKIDGVIKHLTDVCAHIKSKYDVEYEYARLLKWDDIIYDLIIEKNKGRNKKAKFKRYD